KAGIYTLVASSPGLASATSFTFSITSTGGINPVITQDANLVAAVGLPYIYNATGRINASGATPLTFTTCGGPSQFFVDDQTGEVTWSPTTAGVVSLCVEAANAYGMDTYTFSVNVVAAPSGQSPTAAFTVVPPSGSAPLSATFDGTGSTS